MIPWDRFRASVAEAEALARSEDFDPYQMLGEHYASVRRWTPAFLTTFTFQGVPAAASLLRAIDVLRDMNQAGRPSLPKSAPTGFIRERWARHVLPGGAIDRRYYELCVLSELHPAFNASLLSAMMYARRCVSERPDRQIVGICAISSCRAAKTRPCPAIIPPFGSISTGFVKPNSLILPAISAI